jgi:hypothetical protein
MPSVSKKQHNFMAAVAKNPTFAKKVGLKPSVGEHFLTADKGKKFGSSSMKKMRKFAEGDMVEDTEDSGAYVGSRLNMGKDRGSRLGRVSKEDSDMLKKQDAASGMNKNPRMGGLAKAGMSAGLDDAMRARGMKKGGMAHAEKGEMKKDLAQDKKMVKKAVGMHDKQQHGGKKTNLSTLKKGGKVCMARGGGIEIKGKTKGTMIKMKGC